MYMFAPYVCAMLCMRHNYTKPSVTSEGVTVPEDKCPGDFCLGVQTPLS